MRSPRGTGCVQWRARRREDGSPYFSSGLAGRQAARRSSRNPMSSVSRRGVLHGGPTAAPTGTLVRAPRREGGPCLCLPLECAHAQGVLPASNRSAEGECSEPLFRRRPDSRLPGPGYTDPGILRTRARMGSGRGEGDFRASPHHLQSSLPPASWPATSFPAPPASLSTTASRLIGRGARPALARAFSPPIPRTRFRRGVRSHSGCGGT